jgi:hypothetical protein
VKAAAQPSGAHDPASPSGFVEDALVVGFVGGDDVVGAEFFLALMRAILPGARAAVRGRRGEVPVRLLSGQALHCAAQPSHGK